MNAVSRLAPGLVALLLVAGCASTKVTERQSYEGPRIARPDRIVVYDFASTHADIPPGSAMKAEYAPPATPPTAEEIEVGRKLGSEVAKHLVDRIQGMGLPGVRAAGQPALRVGDIVIMGYFEAVDTGSAVKRVALGFGSGAAHLQTVVEGYVVTDKGLMRLGSGVVDSGGGKMPGAALPLAVVIATGNPVGLIVGGTAKVAGEVTGSATIEGAGKRTANEIADQLRVAFERQGWI